MHEKDGLQHYHVVWLRIDCQSKNLRAIPDSHNYRKHEIVARQLEREYGWKHVQGAHIEREGKARPERTPSRRELYQAERTGIKPKEAKALVTELWRGSKTGVEFEIALEGEGWRLAQGDRRDYVLVDPTGGTHSLARRIEGAKAADLRERLDPIKEWLPSVAEAKAVAREGDRRHTWAERAVIEARENTLTGGDFLAEIGEAGITLARVTAQDIADLKAEHALAFAQDEAVPYVPPIIEGDLAAITTTGKILPLSALRLGSAAEYEQRLAADGFPLPSAIEARDSALAIHEGKQQAREERQQAWEAAADRMGDAKPGRTDANRRGNRACERRSQTLDTLDVNEHGLLKTAEAALDKVTGDAGELLCAGAAQAGEGQAAGNRAANSSARPPTTRPRKKHGTTRKSARSKKCFKATAFMTKPSPPKSTKDGRGSKRTGIEVSRASPPSAETADRREGAPPSQPVRRDNQRLWEGFQPPKARPLSTRALADDYVKLCQNPLQNLGRWLNQRKKTPRAGPSARARPTQTDHAQTSQDAHGLRRQPLHPMRGRLDTHHELRQRDHRLLARLQAGAGRYDELRSLRSDRGQQGLSSANDQTRLAFATAQRRATGRPRKQFRWGRAGSLPAPRRRFAGTASISDEGHRELAFVCAQIRNRFGAQIDQARRMAKPEELALIIAHLQHEQQAETAEATRAAQATMRAQQERLRRQQGRAPPAFRRRTLTSLLAHRD